MVPLLYLGLGSGTSMTRPKTEGTGMSPYGWGSWDMMGTHSVCTNTTSFILSLAPQEISKDSMEEGEEWGVFWPEE